MSAGVVRASALSQLGPIYRTRRLPTLRWAYKASIFDSVTVLHLLYSLTLVLTCVERVIYLNRYEMPSCHGA